MERLRSALLLLTALTSASRAEEIIYAQVGQTVTLNPPEGFKSHKYYLTWSFGSQELAWSNHMGGTSLSKGDRDLVLSDSSLTVRNIQPDQFGTYVCEVSQKKLSYKVLSLAVSAKPSSLLLSGQTVTLDCEAQSPSSHQRPQIHWLDPQGDKVEQGSMEAAPRHSGQWTCVVTLGPKTYKAHMAVTVVDLDSPPQQYTSTSAPFSIPCSIPANVPWQQIKALGLQEGHWHFLPRVGGKRLPPEPQRLFSLSLEDPVSWKPDQTRGLTPLSDVKSRNLSLGRKTGGGGDRGDYVCTLTFDGGLTLKRTVHVDVLEITSAPGNDLISGQQLNLTCSLGVPLTSDLRLKWIPPERSSLQPPASGRLAIAAVATTDDGKWRCELWRNSTLLTSATITLKIEPLLSVWMLVIICSGAVILLLLLLLGFILYRRRRARKMRHMRHQLCSCKNPKPKGFYRT